MEENKFYRNAELASESYKDFEKNTKNNFVTDDFERHLDLAMYLSKTKFKQVFASKNTKPITVNTFDKSYLISTGDETFNDVNFFQPFTDLQATPDIFPNLNIKIFQIGNTIDFKKLKYLQMVERRGLNINKRHAYSLTYSFYKNDTDSFYALENGYQINDSFFSIGEKLKNNTATIADFPSLFSLHKGFDVTPMNTAEEITDVSKVIAMSYNIMMSLYYEWTLYIKEKDGVGFVIPINPFMIKEMFDTSLMKFESKSKLIHFVKQHYRKIPQSENKDLTVLVQRYLRGENKIIYRDYKTEIIPPKYELNRLKTRKKITNIFE